MDYLINHAKEKLQNKYAVVQAVLSLIPLSFFPQYFLFQEEFNTQIVP